MNIHEHQAKELFKLYNIPTPEGKTVFSVEDATKAANELPGPVYVVKAQIHAGGRGKGGGVKIAKSLKEVKEISEVFDEVISKSSKVKRLDLAKIQINEGSKVFYTSEIKTEKQLRAGYRTFNLLDIKNNSKLQLTESYAVYPASSVSGWYFSHPESKYFGISRINKEQLIDY